MKFDYDLLFEEINKKGLKLGFIANQTGMTRQNLSIIKNNRGELSGTQIAVICDILRMPMDMFIERE